MIDDYVPITQAKAKMLDIIREVDANDNTIAITKNGVPKAILISMEHYDAIMETMAILADRATMEQIHDSISEIKENKPLVDLESIS